MQKSYYKTIIISDLHLGLPQSKIKELIGFLQSVRCRLLILNGDIIDAWYLKKHRKVAWKRPYLKIQKTLAALKKDGTEIIYIPGNHDDFLKRLTPMVSHGIRFVADFTIESAGKRYFVTHGDIFDNVTRRFTWLSKFGASLYELALKANDAYNRRRLRKRLRPVNIAQRLKLKVKQIVSNYTNFEQQLVSFARENYFDGIICGHIHQPINCHIEHIHYLNSGDWVETKSALTEDENGNWRIIKLRE